MFQLAVSFSVMFKTPKIFGLRLQMALWTGMARTPASAGPMEEGTLTAVSANDRSLSVTCQEGGKDPTFWTSLGQGS